MESTIQDLRQGLRTLRRSPVFAIVATLTLALAIGVNTSIFSLVSVIVFADLPMTDVETVAVVRGTNAELDIDQGSVSEADFLDLVERSRSFGALAALRSDSWVMTGDGEPTRVSGLRFTAGLTDVWGLPPVLGRGFAPEEGRPGGPPVAMLSHAFWEQRFGSRPDVIGETIRLDGIEHTVVGVTHPKLEFGSLRSTQVVTPLVLDLSDADRTARNLTVTGRLAPGVTQEMATEEARRIAEQLAEEHPVQNAGWSLWSAPVMESLIDDDGNTILLFLQLTVGMVILIACANVANMLLARATVRAREIGVRAALGAGRSRLIRQLLTESLVLSLAAATLGIGFANALNEALIWISAGTEEVFLMSELDGRVLAFTLTVSLVAPLAFGLLPALRASATSSAEVLRDGRSGDGGRSGKRMRAALAGAQVALALTLMVVATLLTRTVVNLETRPMGFDPAGLMTVDLSLPETDYADPGARRLFFDEARRVVGGLPAIGTVELTNVIPGADFGALRPLSIEGREPVPGRAPPSGLVVSVSEGFFDLLGLSIQRGRAFSSSDDAEAPSVAIVSRAIADRYWGAEDPIGRRFRISGSEEWIEIVGVVADVRSTTDTEQGALNVYRPYEQDAVPAMYLVARSDGDPASLAGPLRAAVWSVDPDLPVDAIRTVEQAQYENSASTYALITLFVAFAVFALLMAAIGIYGVISYSVSQRRNEIGVRLALGAEKGSVRWMVVGQGIRMLVGGAVVGLLVAFALSRLLANLVFGISTTDPLSFVGVPLVLLGVGVLASLVPAARATRLDPATTLRTE